MKKGLTTEPPWSMWSKLEKKLNIKQSLKNHLVAITALRLLGCGVPLIVTIMSSLVLTCVIKEAYFYEKQKQN